MKIEDNFLDIKEFREIQTNIMGGDFAWFYQNVITNYNDVDKFQFCHLFYANGQATSQSLNTLQPILDKIQNIHSLWRIKSNLLTRTPKIVENELHNDMIGMPEEKIKQWTTSIFYINNNNGYTRFEDGTKVESVANRLVTFSADTKHTGTSCTDERTRVVINFNYFK